MAEDSSRPGSKPPPPTPIGIDGGWGWFTVLGAFIAYFIADGWSYSFGIIYPEFLKQFGDSKGKTAIIGALLYGVPLLVSPIACALTTVYGCRAVAIFGGLLTGLSFILSSLATSVDFLCLSTGILASFGLSMTYVPAIVIVTYYFDSMRGVATGLAVTGSGLGAFAFPPLLEFLLEKYSMRGTLLILGGLSFNICVSGGLFRPPPMTEPPEMYDSENTDDDQYATDGQCSTETYSLSRSTTYHKDSETSSMTLSATARKIENGDQQESCHLLEGDQINQCNPSSPVPSGAPSNEIYINTSPINSPIKVQKKRKRGLTYRFGREIGTVFSNMMDRSLLHCWPYLIYCASGFILYLWIGVPYVYLVDKTIISGVHQNNAAFLMSIIGIARTVGQLVLGYLGDQNSVSTVGLYAAAIFVCGFSTVLVPVFHTYWLVGLYAGMFGFFVSVTYALQMMCVVDCVGIVRATNAFGLMQLTQGISTLLGTPVAGWLFDATGEYNPSFYAAGAWILLSSVMLFPLPRMLRRPRTAPINLEDPNL